MCRCGDDCETLLLEGNPWVRCAPEPAGEWMADAPYGADGQLSHWATRANPLGGKIRTANIAVTTYHGEADGKPVIQIDTSSDTDLRVNVNDGTIFNSSTDSGDWDTLNQAALSWLNELENYIIPRSSAGEGYIEEAALIRAALGRVG